MKVPKREPAEVMIATQEESIDSVVPAVVETPKEEVAEEKPVVTSNKAQKVNPVYTIRVNRNHSCYIGGTYYVFKKNGVYQVPSDVKRILTVAGLLAPL